MTERMNLSQYRQHVGASSVSASGRVVPVAAVKESLTTQRSMMRIELPFPPAKLNPNARHHWKALLKVKETYGQQCFLLANAARRSASWVPAKGEIPLTITYVVPDRRKRDRDNLLAASKRGLDMVAKALGVDDSQFEPILIRREFGKRPGAMIVEV